MPPHREQTYTPPAATPNYLIRHASLRQLQVFEAIVRLGSFTRAADELFVTQPTVSMQTRKLADALGLPLLENAGRQVLPTEAGAELYRACRAIFEVLSNLEMKVADLKGIKRGRLRLGVITTAKYFAPELLGAFCKLYPGIEVALKVSNRDRILDRIDANEDDLYILGETHGDRAEVEAVPFAPNPLVVMAPRDHPLVGEKTIPIARLAEEPFILREPGSGIRDATLRVFEQRGIRPLVRMELGSNEAIKESVEGQLGVSIVSRHALGTHHEGLAVLNVKGFPIQSQWHLVWPKGKRLSPIAEVFRGHLVGEAKGWLGAG